MENHSQRHVNYFSLLGPRGLVAEIERAQDTIGIITGQHPLFLPCARRMRSPFLDPVLSRLGLRLASWTRRGFDTVRRAPSRCSAGSPATSGRAISSCCMTAMRALPARCARDPRGTAAAPRGAGGPRELAPSRCGRPSHHDTSASCATSPRPAASAAVCRRPSNLYARSAAASRPAPSRR